MRVGSASHGDAAIYIFQTIIGFIGDGGPGGFLFHVFVEAAALDHEVIDDAMENSAIVMAAFDILDKVSDCFGCFG